ncbi:PIN domain-like protein [Crucibulum laeve]|uniref:PIN domain-like protein n=1 Tax=Crucibulum laeve TaxID=68775 RepID=A0A5C3LNT9_9AGAR|nr:PIN domain-like protein [Crucibulum laeve]
MGVLGLTPFIQKKCPEVIKQFPNRLQAISGKKIVIDGTLITQRLHFAPSPHPYRHVLGWFRIAQELSENGVSAICVFDGKERSSAKAKEVERRRELRRLVTARGALESDRFQRLTRLKTVIHRFHNLDDKSQQRTSDWLRQADVRTEGLHREYVLLSATEEYPPERLKEMPQHPELNGQSSPPSTVSESLPEEPSIPPSDVNVPTLDEIPDQFAVESKPSGHKKPFRTQIQDQDFPLTVTCSLPAPACERPRREAEDIPSTLENLYREYKNSIPQLASISEATPTPPTPRLPLITTTESEADEDEHVMSKAQQKLTTEEGKIWYDLLLPSIAVAERVPDEEPLDVVAERAIDALTEKSSMMSESFKRRINIPTTQTYEESKEILQAMGVLCVESTGAFEAEALASSIVLNGYADYVASEDTDVLVYEAPLIRNISSRNEPLVLVSGADVRHSLQLERNSFIDFALLLGTDFTSRIKNVGPLRAYKFIKAYGSIEHVVESETKFPLRLPKQAYLDQVEIARMIFHTLPPVPDQIFLKQPKDDSEVALLLQRYQLGRALMVDGEWDYGSALAGNYFEDDPSAF